MPEVDHDPQDMREVARRFREIALNHERAGSPRVAKKMRQATVEIEAVADAIKRGDKK